jgi:hypothetical protein
VFEDLCSSPMKRIVALLFLVVVATGCSLSYQHGGVALGDPFALVQAQLSDLRQPTRIQGEGLKVKKDRWVRIPADDPKVAFEFYNFSQGKLSSIQVAYRADVDPALVDTELEGQLGSPDTQVIGIRYFEKEGGKAIFADFGEPRSVTFYFAGEDEEEEEEAIEVSMRSSLLVGRKTSYRFAYLGLTALFALAAIAGVLVILRELQQVRRSTPAIRSRADLDAFRRLGYRHKLVDVVASVLLLLGAASTLIGFMAEEVKGLDLLLVTPVFLTYAGLGKSYSLLGKSITSTHRVEDPDQQEAWDAWLAVMNAPLGLANARGHAKDAGA